jgi:hypothetical protein
MAVKKVIVIKPDEKTPVTALPKSIKIMNILNRELI